VSAVLAVVVRLDVRALPRTPAAPVVANTPAPLTVPTPDAGENTYGSAGSITTPGTGTGAGTGTATHAVNNSTTAAIIGHRVFIGTQNAE
jgi:hypothetical protein